MRHWPHIRILVAAAVIAAPLTAVGAEPEAPLAQASGQHFIQQSQRYIQCTVQSKLDAEKGLAIAETWLKEQNDPAAMHCKALSLFQLQRFVEAADLLEFLTILIPDDQPELWSKVVMQAGHARKQAGQMSKAIENFSVALDTIADRPLNTIREKLLVERAKAYHAQGKSLEAIQDLDHALAIAPENVNALLTRAYVFLSMEKRSLAKDDLESVLALSPENIKAKEVLNQL